MKTEELIARVRQLVTPPTPEEVEELCSIIESLREAIKTLRECQSPKKCKECIGIAQLELDK